MRSAAPPTARTGPEAARTAPRRPGRPAGLLRRSRVRDPIVALLLLAPALIIFALFKFIPMGRAIQMSFYEVRPYLGDRWVGLENYSHVVSDPEFLSAIWHTVVLAAAQTAGSMLLGLALALLVEGAARHLWFVRTVVFLPTVVTMAVIAEVWRILYYPAPDGIVNEILSWIGMGPSSFLNSEDSSMQSVIAVGIWRGAPYDMMIILAGLAGVDRTLYEASAVDGAGIRRRLWHVTMPALRPVFVILLTLAAIRGMRVFTEVFLLTNGGPDGSTEVLMTLIYKLGLERHELGIAAAGSVVLLAVTVALTLAVQIARSRGRQS